MFPTNSLEIQSSSGSLIYYAYKYKIQETTFADIDRSAFSSFIFKVNHVFMEKKENSSEVVIDEEELDGFEIDGIENLQDLPRTVIIN